MVSVPVIASGGAGTVSHFAEVLTKGNADAALAASLFHDGEEEFTSIKTKDKSGKTNKSKTTSKIHQKERKGNEHKQNLNDKGDREDDRSADDNEDESLISLKTKTKSKKPSSSNNAHDFNSWTQLIQVRLNKMK